MYIVGLTGGIGSGKSTIAREFEKLGIETVDSDLIAHEVVAAGEPALAEIAAHFGEDVLLPNGQLDRARLRTLVFEQPQQRQWLENLIHPLVRARTLAQLAAACSPYVLLVSPLLLETDQHQLVNHIIVVDVPVRTQIERTVARDQNTEAQVQAIIDAQMARELRLAKADTVIDNSQHPTAVATAVKAVDQKLRQLAATENQ